MLQYPVIEIKKELSLYFSKNEKLEKMTKGLDKFYEHVIIKVLEGKNKFNK